jgi:hypothetical protein
MLCGYYATTFLVQLIRLFDKHTGAKQWSQPKLPM